jgi:pimeloyl-ACP methyl ester carboxylesterase
MGEYVQLGTVNTWYEVDGAGDPLLLLHGGLSEGSAWGAQLPALTPTFRTYVPDRRGHGRTPDPDPAELLTYDAMADDTIAFLEAVVGGPAHLVGWSDGGIVSIAVSLKRPDLVRRLVLIGANFHYEGLLDAFDLPEDPDDESIGIFKHLYVSVAVDGPEHWPIFLAKTRRMWTNEPTWSTDDIARIAAPTLVLVGDDDAMTYEHTIALFDALQESQLAVVPGTSHVLTLEKPALVNQLIVDFLGETEPPQTMVPVRRAR